MYENIFFDLSEQDLLVLVLNETNGANNKNASSMFSFKGKCMMGLMWGQVNVKGYSIRMPNINQIDPIRWFKLYSPEYTSFLAIRNGLPQSR